MPIQQSHGPPQSDRKLFRIGDVPRIYVMTEAEPVFSVQHIAQAHLPQTMPTLLVVPALRQSIACARAGLPSAEIRRVVGQQAATDQLLVFPDRQQAQLRLLELIAFSTTASLDAMKSIPEFLRGEALGRETPERRQNGVTIPIRHFRFRPRLTDALNRGQEQIVCCGGTGRRFLPEGLEHSPDAGLLGGAPEGSRQAKIEGGDG